MPLWRNHRVWRKRNAKGGRPSSNPPAGGGGREGCGRDRGIRSSELRAQGSALSHRLPHPRSRTSAMSTFGTIFRVTTFGESHCKGVGAIVDGVPPCMCADTRIQSPPLPLSSLPLAH